MPRLRMPQSLAFVALGAVAASCTSNASTDAGDRADTTLPDALADSMMADGTDAADTGLDGPQPVDCGQTDNLCPVCCFPAVYADGAPRRYDDGGIYCLC